MLSCMFFSTVNTSLGLSTIITVRLSAQSFLGLVGEAAPLPIKFKTTLWNFCHLPIIVYFYKVYLSTLDVYFFWILNRVRFGHSLLSYSGCDTKRDFFTEKEDKRNVQYNPGYLVNL